MRIEAGSQNASRIPGTYAYPVHRYNPAGVEAVTKVRGKTGRALQAAAQHVKPMTDTNQRDPIYEISRSTRAAKYLGVRGQHVNRLA